MISIEPQGSAEMSQIASSRCGRLGQPGLVGTHGDECGRSNVFASGIVMKRGAPGAQ